MKPYQKTRARERHRIMALKLHRVSLCASPANEFAKVALFKTREGHLADPATSRACSRCKHVRAHALTRCPACGHEEEDMKSMNISDRISAYSQEAVRIAKSALGGGDDTPKRSALAEIMRRLDVSKSAGREPDEADVREMLARDPVLRAEYQREVSKALNRDRDLFERYRSEATARKVVPTAEDARDEGRRLNGRPGPAGKCPKCDAPLVDTRGAFCASCGHQLPVAKGLGAATVDVIKARMADDDLTEDVLKALNAGGAALDTLMRTTAGRRWYAGWVERTRVVS